MRRSVVLLVMVIGFCGSSVASGAELNVPAEYSTIQAAINAASDGDTVLIADGTYTGDGNRDIDFDGKAITVRSENGPENCIIDCQASDADRHRAFYLHSGEGRDSVIQGFTITNGIAPIKPFGEMGLVNLHCKTGAGILCIGSSPSIVGNIITGNQGSSGAGISSQQGAPLISGNTITENTAPNGAGVLCFKSTATITDNMITRNHGHLGGGIICRGSSSVIISDSVITGNDSDRGAGIYSWVASSVVVTNTLIAGNSGWNGAGLLCEANSSLTIRNCTVSGNSSDLSSAAWAPDCTAEITGCIIWGNPQGGIGIGGTTSVSYSNIEGFDEVKIASLPESVTWGPGNINIDPLFAQPGHWKGDSWGDWVDGDYHLQSKGGRLNPANDQWTTDDAHSPCIDAAKPTADFAAEPFPNGERVNMGAYGGTAQASKSHPSADVNNDACVNVADLLIVRNDLGSTSSPGVELLRADVNGDGVVNIADLLMVRNRLGEGGGCP